MAAGNNNQSAGAGVTPGTGQSNKKLVLLIVAVALVTVVISAGLTWYLLSGGQNTAADTSVTGTSGQKALYLELPPAFLVTYNHQNRQRYMQVSVTALTRDPRAVDVMS